MLRIYCETGAYRQDLKALERDGQIQVVQFKYENRNRHIRESAQPSNPTVKEMNYTWAELRSDPILSQLTLGSIGETSEKFQEILDAIGRSNVTDAKHIDSAYRAKCRAFLTSDKDDIVVHKRTIQRITGIEVFHATDDWNELLEFIASQGDRPAKR